MATKSYPVNFIIGGACFGDTSVDPLARFDTKDEVNAALDAFASRGFRQIDTARAYGSSEIRLGSVNAGERFPIDTKVDSQSPNHTKENILKEIDTSLKQLNIKQINVQYLHIPDRSTKLDEACEAMDQAHKEGKIKAWGVSNHSPDEIRTIIRICDEQGYVKPSVYQGHYNVVVRGAEEGLLPLLRENGISFYAYSVGAGGFLAGGHKAARTGGRFDKSHMVGTIYTSTYVQKNIMDATETALAEVSKHGIGGHEAALRWAIYHSALHKEHGDGVILAASTLEQLQSNLEAIDQGPLPHEVVAALDRIHQDIGEPVAYHF